MTSGSGPGQALGGWTNLVPHPRSYGVTDQEMITAGSVANISRLIDRFHRGR
jgi:hypothetical protein